MCIWIINHQAGEIVYQPIVQLFGFDSFYHETILVNNKYQWPIVQGLFKVKFLSRNFFFMKKFVFFLFRFIFNLKLVKIKLNYQH